MPRWNWFLSKDNPCILCLFHHFETNCKHFEISHWVFECQSAIRGLHRTALHGLEYCSMQGVLRQKGTGRPTHVGRSTLVALQPQLQHSQIFRKASVLYLFKINL